MVPLIQSTDSQTVKSKKVSEDRRLNLSASCCTVQIVAFGMGFEVLKKRR
jgi:hypothetical protein